MKTLEEFDEMIELIKKYGTDGALKPVPTESPWRVEIDSEIKYVCKGK